MEAINMLIIGVAAVLVFGLALQVSFLAEGAGGNAVAGNGQVDTAGWTENEKMNYEMHGTVPARLQGSIQNSPSSGMVGGC